MYATYNISVGVKGMLNAYFTHKLATSVKYVNIIKAKKQVKIQHNWSSRSL